MASTYMQNLTNLHQPPRRVTPQMLHAAQGGVIGDYEPAYLDSNAQGVDEPAVAEEIQAQEPAQANSRAFVAPQQSQPSSYVSDVPPPITSEMLSGISPEVQSAMQSTNGGNYMPTTPEGMTGPAQGPQSAPMSSFYVPPPRITGGMLTSPQAQQQPMSGNGNMLPQFNGPVPTVAGMSSIPPAMQQPAGVGGPPQDASSGVTMGTPDTPMAQMPPVKQDPNAMRTQIPGSAFGAPSASEVYNQIAQRQMNQPPPSVARLVAAGLVSLIPGGSAFAPMIARGPKALQDQANLARAEQTQKIANETQQVANQTQQVNQLKDYQQGELQNRQDETAANVYRSQMEGMKAAQGVPIPNPDASPVKSGFTRVTIHNPATKGMDTYDVPDAFAPLSVTNPAAARVLVETGDMTQDEASTPRSKTDREDMVKHANEIGKDKTFVSDPAILKILGKTVPSWVDKTSYNTAIGKANPAEKTPKEDDEQIPSSKFPDRQAEITRIWNEENPGIPVPGDMVLKPGATNGDFKAIKTNLDDLIRVHEGIANKKAAQAAQQLAASNTQADRLFKDKAETAKEWEKKIEGASAQTTSITQAGQMLDSGNAAQALAVPKTLSALVAGNGTGVRITQPELDNIYHSNGIVGDVQAWIEKQTQKGVLAPAAVKQLHKALDDSRDLILEKYAIASEANRNIRGANSTTEINAAHLAGQRKEFISEVSHVMPQGNGQTLDAAAGRAILKAANGDKVLAQEIAEHSGWKVPGK